MRKYYTRACNFYYGANARKFINKKLALPLCGNKNIAFDSIEILSRDKDVKLLNIKNIKKLPNKIKKIVEAGYDRAKKVLTEKIDDLHKIAKALLLYETLTGDEIRDLMLKNIQPKKLNESEDGKDNKESSALDSLGLKPKLVH